MTEPLAKQISDQDGSLANARNAENVQAVALQGVAASKNFYSKAAAATQDGAKAITEIADTAWSNSKMLNERLVQNLTANSEVAFGAAQAIATAKSWSEITKLQSEFLQKMLSQTTEQINEFFDLSARATQHLMETSQAAATKPFVSAHYPVSPVL